MKRKSFFLPIFVPEKRLLTWVMSLIVFFLFQYAQAATFTVNSTADPGAGGCTAAECTLREAIAAANANAGTDIIEFNIPGTGPHTIQPPSTQGSMTITDPVIIDGYTQPGANPNTNGPGLGSNAVLKIELNGINSSVNVDGLRIFAGNSTVKGLVINRFAGNGIQLFGSVATGNLVQGNFIGTDVSGTLDLGNTFDGIRIVSSAADNTIGGMEAEARNVISGNNSNGVNIQASATGNFVQGNFIGTDVTGTIALGNGSGVLVIAPDNTIGGVMSGAGNVISGNNFDGVDISLTIATGNLVQGNFIGTDVTGTANLGNLFFGVAFRIDASNNTVGGLDAGAGNVIAFNGIGVRLSDGTSGTGNAILGNSVFSNDGFGSGLGIDLSGDGVTPNDPGDGDTGLNNLQNFPELMLATTGGVEGTLNSTPNTTFRLEFFANSTCDPSGFGEGETFLGSTSVTTDGTGNRNFTASFPVPLGDFVTATATDPDNNTSEFSKCDVEVVASPVDHFLSYQIKHTPEVFLADQFMQGFFEIKDPVALLNPADKDGEGIFDPDIHLVSYKVKGPEFDQVENVLVENQFGGFFVDVKEPDRLLVPASKSLIAPVSAPDNSTHNVDHFLCYKVKESEGSDFPRTEVFVVDQFEQPKFFEVKKPRRLCNPTAKEFDGHRVDIKNPETHLLCYDVKPAKGQPRHERFEGIFVNDQFGPGRADTKIERELCVPSTLP